MSARASSPQAVPAAVAASGPALHVVADDLPSAARAYRASPCRPALEALAAHVRTVAADAARSFHNIPPQIREEIVQDRTWKLVRHLVVGDARPGREVGLVRAAVRNALRDHLRRRRCDALSRAVPLDDVAPPAAPAPSPDLEPAARACLDLVAQLRSPAHREVLRWVLGEGRTLGELVERDVRQAVDDGALDPDDPHAIAAWRRRCRERRDKHWQRGRHALLRVLIAEHTELLASAPAELRRALEDGYARPRLPADEGLLARGRRWLLAALLDEAPTVA